MNLLVRDGFLPYLDFDSLPPVGRRWHTEEQVADIIAGDKWRIGKRGLAGLLITGAMAMFFSRESEAATNFLWEGAGSYGVGVTNLLTTELNALANTSNTAAGSAFQNTNARLYADMEYVAGGAKTPTAGAFIAFWWLVSVDGGTNYEDGSSSITPGRNTNASIGVRAGTSITPRAGAPGVRLPPAFAKPLAQNQTGDALAATSNLIRQALYTVQY